jgi:hypothetical protein
MLVELVRGSLDVEPWLESDDISKATELGKWSMSGIHKYTHMYNVLHKLMNVRNIFKQHTDDPDVINWKFDAEMLADTTVLKLF